ncbi:hypothetical protein ACFQY7_40630 [Actinomadura luteofluorescens]|uniref:hypothetical protein n=1 Tax=Actinomadura luteofluorescens TaxID=46163 RepID=UPI0036455A61
MRRSSALLATAALTSSAFLAPSAARADATDGTTRAASVTADKQATVITARMGPNSTVSPGTVMTVYGSVLRQASTGPEPVEGLEIQLDVPPDLLEAGSIKTTRTFADGSFRAAFTVGRQVGKSGAVTVRFEGNEVLTGSQASLGTLNVRNYSEITDFNAIPEPHAYRDPIVADGRLYVRPGDTGATELPLYLEYSLDGKTWRVWAAQTLARPMYFTFNDAKLVTKDAYWRVRYPGSLLTMPSVSTVDFVDVKYRTEWYVFNASPEPVKKGGTITVKGQLFRFRDLASPAPNAPVYVYFRRAGTSKWVQMAATKTNVYGWFSKKFRASADGTWKAVYKESSGYIGSTSPADTVDVR